MARRDARRRRRLWRAFVGAALAVYLGYAWISRTIPSDPELPGNVADRSVSGVAASGGRAGAAAEVAPDPVAVRDAGGVGENATGVASPEPTVTLSPRADAQAKREGPAAGEERPAPHESLNDEDRRALEAVLDRAASRSKSP